jgi:hypothetical protein
MNWGGNDGELARQKIAEEADESNQPTQKRANSRGRISKLKRQKKCKKQKQPTEQPADKKESKQQHCGRRGYMHCGKD